MKTTEIAVEFQNVTKAFGDVQAVQNLNFSIDWQARYFIRPFWMRKDNNAEVDRRVGDGHGRKHLHRWKRSHEAFCFGPRRKYGFPILRTFPSHDSNAERFLWPGHESNAKTGGKRKSIGGVRISRTSHIWSVVMLGCIEREY